MNKIGYSISGLDRFDIIVFHGKEGYDLVKRVIGLPGDTVEYKNDVLYVNGKAMEEPYLKSLKKSRSCINSRLYVRTNHWENESARRPSICFRDNREVSKDGRMFGFISEDEIVGKGQAVFWPLEQVRAL